MEIKCNCFKLFEDNMKHLKEKLKNFITFKQKNSLNYNSNKIQNQFENSN